MPIQTLKALERFKVIKQGDGRNLDQLDLNAGDLVGIYARNPGAHTRFDPYFFVLAKVKEPVLTRFGEGKGRAIYLEHFPRGINEGGWNMHADSHLRLLVPFTNIDMGGIKVPQIECLIHGYYSADSVYVGKDNVVRALRDTPSFELYANWLENGGLK